MMNPKNPFHHFSFPFHLLISFHPLTITLIALLAFPLCAGPVWLGAQQIDLLHLACVNGCAFRAYEFHVQDQQRYPERISYDFTNSPESLIVAIVWIENGPTINLSQPIPLACPVRR
jgi:hypothetical protein